VALHTEDGLDLTAWHAPATGQATAITVLVLPGNAGSRATRVPLARALSAAGFDVLLLDYRGYGNPGSPTEEGPAADARAAHRHLVAERGVPPARLVLFGERLGAAVATRLALERPVAGLVLRSPFTSLADVGAALPVPAGPGAATGPVPDPANHRHGHRAGHGDRWGRRRDRAARAQPSRRRRRLLHRRCRCTPQRPRAELRPPRHRRRRAINPVAAWGNTEILECRQRNPAADGRRGMAVRSDRMAAARPRNCRTCRRDTLNRVTATIDDTRQDENVNAAG
jgi:pimeloyl-ACP methyl ester carboxylesterase